MSNITIVKTLNPLAPQDKTIECIPFERGMLVSSLLPTEGKFNVVVNGVVVPEDVYNTTLVTPNSVVNIVPVLAGGSNTNSILASIATIALVAAVMSQPWMTPILAAGGWSAFGGYMLLAGVGILGGMVFNRIFPTKMPSLPSINTNADTSSTYGWSPQTTQQQGGCIPVIYGKVKATGNIIGAYTETDGEKQYLAVLISLGRGILNNIYNLKLNDQPIENYTNVNVEIRNGTLNQPVITTFNDTVVQYTLSQKIVATTDTLYTLPVAGYDKVTLVITCPSGLYKLQASTGAYETLEVSLSIYYAEEGGAFVFAKNLLLSGRKPTSFSKTVSIEVDKTKKYTFKIDRTTPDSTSQYRVQDTYLTAVQGVTYDDFVYPSTALVGIKALASDQISGSFSFSCTVEGKLVNVYDGSSWSVEYSNNPAWVCFDILTRPLIDDSLNIVRYDGVAPSRIDTDSFYEWASFCDELVTNDDGTIEKRYTHNRVFDTINNVWEAALSVCSSAQAMLVRSGTGIYVLVDKERTPTALFNMGNIVQGSFTSHFMPLADRVSSLEITYNDESEDFERTVLKVIDPNETSYDNSGNISLDGITSVNQAWRLACISLNKNRLLREFAEFKVPMEALASTVGDVIYLSHDIPFWNESGRVVEATSSTVVVDTPLAFDISKSYQLLIRDNQTDAMVIKDVLSVTDGTIVTIDGTFGTLPNEYDLFSFGEVENILKTFQIVKISVTAEQQFTLSCVEYNSDVYTPFVYTADDRTPTTVDRSVTNLQVSTHKEFGDDGSTTQFVDVYWGHPALILAKEYRVYYQLTGTPILVGTTKDTGFSFVAPIADTITVFVTSIDVLGVEENIQDASSVVFILNNTIIAISDVQNIWATVNSGILQLDWDDVVSPILSYYEIRYSMHPLSSWEQASVVAVAKASTVAITSANSGLYLIKAVSNTGVYSQVPASVYTNIPELQREKIIGSFTEDFQQGTLENLYLEDSTTLSMVGAGDFDDIIDLNLVFNLDLYGGVYTEGTYYFENSFNLQGVKTFRCKIEVDYFKYDLDDEFDAIADLDLVAILGVTPDDVYVTVYASTSTDDITYTDYLVYSGGVLSTRYVKFKLVITTDNPQHYAKVTAVTGQLYTLERVEEAQDVPVLVSGLSVSFATPYEARPHIGITIQGGNVGDNYRLTSISNTGFTLGLYDISGTPTTGNIDWYAQGY